MWSRTILTSLIAPLVISEEKRVTFRNYNVYADRGGYYFRQTNVIVHMPDIVQDMIKPAVYRHVALDRNGSLPGPQDSHGMEADHITALARLLDQTTDSGLPKASWVRSFSIQEHTAKYWKSKKLRKKALSDLVFHMTNLHEFCCRFVLNYPTMTSIARSHGSQLTKMVMHFGGDIHTSERLLLLNHFTALTELRLSVSDSYSIEIEPLDLPNLRSLELVTEPATGKLLAWLTHWNMPVLSAFAYLKPPDRYSYGMRHKRLLAAFMARHGAGLKTVTIDCTAPKLTVFPYTPSLDIYKQCDIPEVIEGLPISVTQIFTCEFGQNLGYQVLRLECLFQTVQSLPPERSLHTIRVVSRDKYLGGSPFLWRDQMKWADTRRINTWKDFNKYAKGLLELGVSMLDEQNVVLTDVLEEMKPSQESISTELLESATDALLESEE